MDARNNGSQSARRGGPQLAADSSAVVMKSAPVKTTREQESRGLRTHPGSAPCSYFFTNLGTTSRSEVAWRKKVNSR
jgi:hypothetical protein